MQLVNYLDWHVIAVLDNIRVSQLGVLIGYISIHSLDAGCMCKVTYIDKHAIFESEPLGFSLVFN